MKLKRGTFSAVFSCVRGGAGDRTGRADGDLSRASWRLDGKERLLPAALSLQLGMMESNHRFRPSRAMLYH